MAKDAEIRPYGAFLWSALRTETVSDEKVSDDAEKQDHKAKDTAAPGETNSVLSQEGLEHKGKYDPPNSSSGRRNASCKASLGIEEMGYCTVRRAVEECSAQAAHDRIGHDNLIVFCLLKSQPEFRGGS
jgi:hypothetical protein